MKLAMTTTTLPPIEAIIVQCPRRDVPGGAIVCGEWQERGPSGLCYDCDAPLPLAAGWEPGERVAAQLPVELVEGVPGPWRSRGVRSPAGKRWSGLILGYLRSILDEASVSYSWGRCIARGCVFFEYRVRLGPDVVFTITSYGEGYREQGFRLDLGHRLSLGPVGQAPGLRGVRPGVMVKSWGSVVAALLALREPEEAEPTLVKMTEAILNPTLSVTCDV